MTRPKTTLSIPTPRGKTRGSKSKKSTPSSSRTIMPERGIDLVDNESWLINEVSALNWELLVEPPAQANSEFVLEFLKVAKEESFPSIRIKGKDVCFSESEIDESFNTAQVPLDQDEYEIYCQNTNEDVLREILGAVCYEGVEWGAGYSLSRKNLKFEAKVWMHFINSRIIPGSHDTRVNWERVVLVFCIMMKKKFDVGRIICNQLIANVTKKGPFYFPCLVSDICRRAGLESKESDVEELIPLVSSIDGNTLKRIRKNEGLEVEETEEIKGEKQETGGTEEETRKEEEEEKGEEVMSESDPQNKEEKKKASVKPVAGKRRMKVFEVSSSATVGQTILGMGADVLMNTVQHIDFMVSEELKSFKEAVQLIEKEKRILQLQLERYQAEGQPSKKGKLGEGAQESPSELEKAVKELVNAVNLVKEELTRKNSAQEEEKLQMSNELKKLRGEMEGMKEKELQYWSYVRTRDQIFDANWEAKFKRQERFPAFPDILPPAALTSAPEEGATASQAKQ